MHKCKEANYFCQLQIFIAQPRSEDARQTIKAHEKERHAELRTSMMIRIIKIEPHSLKGG